MIAWIASFLPVGSAFTRAGMQTEREYFSQASFNLTRGFSLDPGRDAKGSTCGAPMVEFTFNKIRSFDMAA
jgi:hypothetical protein